MSTMRQQYEHAEHIGHDTPKPEKKKELVYCVTNSIDPYNGNLNKSTSIIKHVIVVITSLALSVQHTGGASPCHRAFISALKIVN